MICTALTDHYSPTLHCRCPPGHPTWRGKEKPRRAKLNLAEIPELANIYLTCRSNGVGLPKLAPTNFKAAPILRLPKGKLNELQCYYEDDSVECVSFVALACER